MKKYSHIKKTERLEIAILLKKGYSIELSFYELNKINLDQANHNSCNTDCQHENNCEKDCAINQISHGNCQAILNTQEKIKTLLDKKNLLYQKNNYKNLNKTPDLPPPKI